MGVIGLGGSCPSNRLDYPWGEISYRGNGPRGGVVLVGNWKGGSCPMG